MFTQLNPPLPVEVVDRGPGYAIAVIDYGQEHNLIWVTAINATGEIWCAPNPKVRMCRNWTMGRMAEAERHGVLGGKLADAAQH
jgi:hypothetical protein